jgi:glycosyltransferase involved in cell wall biosynthesis
MHDGIDTNLVVPDSAVSFTLDDGTTLTRSDEVITFVNRNLEPYRGFHIFMRALPAVLKRRPEAHVLIVGGDDVSYGSRPPEGGSWKKRFCDEVHPLMSEDEWKRIHFLGKIPWPRFVKLLQLSTVHVYLTYPFVLSWSLLEAMSAGCAIVASDTAPVREVITHEETGHLVDFFDAGSLAEEICTLLENPAQRQRLGTQARGFVQERYDLRTICLPGQITWIRQLAGR